MKEATGELSTTAIAIVAIAAILAIFTAILLPMLRTQITLRQACTNGPGYTINNPDKSSITCDKVTSGTAAANNRKWTCTYKDSNGKTSTVNCSD